FVGVADRDAELVFDGGEEFVECPAHAAPTGSVGIMIVFNVVARRPPRNSCGAARDRAVLFPLTWPRFASRRRPRPRPARRAGVLRLADAPARPHGSRHTR